MSCKNPKAQRAEAAPTASEKEDLTDEALVLGSLLTSWPTQLREADLERELQLGSDKFEHRDRVQRAATQLRWAGLLECSGPFLIPTRPTFQFFLLLSETEIDF